MTTVPVQAVYTTHAPDTTTAIADISTPSDFVGNTLLRKNTQMTMGTVRSLTTSDALGHDVPTSFV